MNTIQAKEYETYFESLSTEYTDKPVEAMCTIMKQDVLLTLDLQRVLMVDYRIIWQYKNMMTMNDRDKDIAEELISDYTKYINKEESIEGIKQILNSMFVPVEEVQPAVMTNSEIILEGIN